MTGTTDWLSAIAILASGLILGVLFVIFFSRKKAAADSLGGDADLELQDLHAKRDALILQLRELDTDAKLTPSQRDAERARLEREAAQVLRAIDQDKKKTTTAKPGRVAAAAAAPAPVGGLNPTVKGFVWGVGSFAVLAGIAWFAMKASSPREQQAGNAPMQQQQQQAQTQQQADPALQQLEALVAKSPDDLSLRDDLAKAYLERDNMMAVFEQTQYVLGKAPQDPRALTYQALVRMAMGQGGTAEQMLDAATKKDPGLLDAWVAKAWYHATNGKMDKSRAAIDAAIKQHPEEQARLEQVFTQMKQEIANRGAQPAATSNLPPDHPALPAPGEQAMPTEAAAAAPPPTAAPTAAGPAIHITLNLDASAKSRSGVVYIIARPAGVSAGPPAAVKRIGGFQFPMTIDLSSADSMMGQPLPDKVHLEARLDADGNAMTKDPNDPIASADNVPVGSSVTFTLK